MDSNEPQSALQKLLKIVTYPVAAVSGYLVTKTHVNDAAYEQLKYLDGFGDRLQEGTPLGDHRLEKKSIVARGRADMKEGRDASYVVDELAKKMKDFAPEVVQEMQAMGVKGITKEWKIIGASQRARAVAEGLTVSGVAIGAMLTIANSKAVADVFSKNENENSTPAIGG